MKLVLLIIVLLALLVVYFGYPLYRATRISKQIESRTTAYEQRRADPSMRILVAGDSTGVGTGAERSEDSIAGRIGNDIPEADITNISENGLMLAGLRKHLTELPDEVRYDLILLQIGANDVVGIGSLAYVEQELQTVLDEAEAHADQIIVMTAGNIGLSPVFRWPSSRYISHRTRIVREIFLQEASERSSVTYIDLYKPAGEEVFNTDVPRYYAADRFHPSGEGYGVWYGSVQPKLPTPVLPQAQDR